MHPRLERIYETIIALPREERLAKARQLREKAEALTGDSKDMIIALADAIERL